MSRPTDADRYAQADQWMREQFGEAMPAYVERQLRTPMTAAVRETRFIIETAEARDLLETWRKEDALSNAGAKPIFTVTCALTLILLHVRLGRVPQVTSIADTFHQLGQRQRDDLQLVPRHKVVTARSYDRILEAINRMIVLVDEFYIPLGAPPARHTILTGKQYSRLIKMRDPERCARNRERMHELANGLLEASMKLMPAELLERWEGNMAGDATLIPMLGKAGNPRGKNLTADRRSINVDAGYYRRGGNHDGYTREDAADLKKQGVTVQGSSSNKLVYGIEAEKMRMTPNVSGSSGDFPLLNIAVGFHIPGALSGAGAEMVTSVFNRGHRVNYTIFDRAYPGGYVSQFHHPIRALGGKLVFDYDITEFGVRAQDGRGFIQIVGSWFLDNLPERLREIDQPMVELRSQAKQPLSEQMKAERRHSRAVKHLQQAKQLGSRRDMPSALHEFQEATAELEEVTKRHKDILKKLRLAEATYTMQLAERRQYRLTPKGRMAPDGSRRYLVPDTSKVPLAGPQRFTKTTVTITADLTADINETDANPGGLRHEQHLEYGTEEHRKVYGMRNGIESLNRNVKRAQHGDIANADRRHVRGNTFTYIVVAVNAVCENIRRILKFLKEQLAIRPLTSKNMNISENFWEPEPRADELDPPLRH